MKAQKNDLKTKIALAIAALSYSNCLYLAKNLIVMTTVVVEGEEAALETNLAALASLTHWVGYPHPD
jgi:hypothetical protein